MTRNFKKFKELHHHEEDDCKPFCKKQKRRTDIKEKMRQKAELKAHFPDRVWGLPNERKKGPKI